MPARHLESNHMGLLCLQRLDGPVPYLDPCAHALAVNTQAGQEDWPDLSV